jgi:hypothetical protein
VKETDYSVAGSSPERRRRWTRAKVELFEETQGEEAVLMMTNLPFSADSGEGDH